MMLNTTPIPHERTGGVTQVRTDVFPAAVSFSFGDNPYAKARAIVTVDSILILVEAGSAPGVLYEGRLEDLTFNGRTAVATTEDGEITISRAHGCGCGSRLRSYRPFGRAVRMAMQRA
jgi:hypothetical protein